MINGLTVRQGYQASRCLTSLSPERPMAALGRRCEQLFATG